MPLVFGAITPHGSEIVPQLADDPKLMEKTRDAMREVGRRFLDSQPETVIVLDPHADFMVPHAICIGATFRAVGVLGDPAARHIQAEFDCDYHFVEAFFSANAERLPLIRAVGRDEGRNALLPLSWGALIPLWFTAHTQRHARPKIVVVAPSRLLPREILVQFGVELARAAAASPKRIALIASCDQGHAHDPDGPYGFDPASAEHDLLMCDAIISEDLGSLLDWAPEFLTAAKVDAYWQTIILAGALSVTPLRAELLSYEAPTYFGMAVATYEIP